MDLDPVLKRSKEVEEAIPRLRLLPLRVLLEATHRNLFPQHRLISCIIRILTVRRLPAITRSLNSTDSSYNDQLSTVLRVPKASSPLLNGSERRSLTLIRRARAEVKRI